MFPILTKCIFVIFDEMTNVKIKSGRSSCLNLIPSILYQNQSYLVQVLVQFMIIKMWPGLFVRTFRSFIF